MARAVIESAPRAKKKHAQKARVELPHICLFQDPRHRIPKACGKKLSYTGFRTHMIVQHLKPLDREDDWNPTMYRTHARVVVPNDVRTVEDRVSNMERMLFAIAEHVGVDVTKFNDGSGNAGDDEEEEQDDGEDEDEDEEREEEGEQVEGEDTEVEHAEADVEGEQAAGASDESDDDEEEEADVGTSAPATNTTNSPPLSALFGSDSDSDAVEKESVASDGGKRVSTTARMQANT